MINIGSACDPGMKRKEKPNQDSIGIFLPKFPYKRPPLLIVADGMGGFQEGARASQITVNETSRVYRNIFRKNNWEKLLRKGVSKAHKKIKNYVKKHSDVISMGTTIAAGIFDENKFHLINVGDSRIYLINEQEISLVSHDHSLVAEQVRQGILTPEEANRHPRRNVLMLSISSKQDKIEPFISTVECEDGDYILICSDGLWGTVSESQIQDVVLELTPQEAADKLVQMANMNQGPDNISVIIAQYSDGENE